MNDEFVPGYEPKELDAIDAQHKAGRLMPFIEFPLMGGQWTIRLLRDGDRYTCNIGPLEATQMLRSVNEAYRSRK